MKAPNVIRFEQQDVERVWRAHNSTVEAIHGPEGVVWRWRIEAGREAFLWVSEAMPFHGKMNRYDRLAYDVRFAEGRIERFWPQMAGLLAPPFEHVQGEWNLFHFTTPHGPWITYHQVFDDPTWNGRDSSLPPADGIDTRRMLAFNCLPKTLECVVELRNVRLVRDRVRVLKPYLTDPNGWPVLEGSGSYRSARFVKNVSGKTATVTAALRSEHEFFDVGTEPPRVRLRPGEIARIDVLATPRGDAPLLAHETAVVDFVPDGDDDLAYRTEAFCTAALPVEFPRVVVVSSSEIAELRKERTVEPAARFWMNLPLSRCRSIPGHVGRRPISVAAEKCPRCGRGRMKVTDRWREAACSRRACGHVEARTQLADSLWVATWSSLHQHGPSPVALGRAYLATSDEKYARKAIELLTLIARYYRKLPWHNVGHPQGGGHEERGPEAWANGSSARWGGSPSYGTSWMVQGLAELHNMVADSPSWTDEQRRAVAEGLWVPAVTEMAKIVPGLSNMNDIMNRDMVLAGHAVGDANMIWRGVYHPAGLLGRLRDVAADGFPSEGAPLNYHMAAMNEWLPSILLLANSRLPWGESRARVLAALRMPLLRAGLDGIAYCTGNSGMAWHAVDPDDRRFRTAEKVFGPDEWPRKRRFSKEPVLFPDAGWAILRTGSRADNQVVVNMDYGRTHGHGDLDRMVLSVMAFGVPLSADPGSEYNFHGGAEPGAARDCMAGPFAHNTVVVDGRHQLRGAGTLVSWQPDERVQAVSAEIRGVYPGVLWRRSVALAAGVVVIVDDLRSEAEHRYELCWKHMGSFALEADIGPAPESVSSDLLDARGFIAGPVVATWEVGGVKLRLWHPAAAGQVTYTAKTGICWGTTRGLPVDNVIARRDAKRTRFVTVLEPWKGRRVLKSVESADRGDRTTVTLVPSRGEALSLRFHATASGDAAVTSA